MKAPLTLILCIAAACAGAQSRYGYSSNQILAMPPEKWMEVYAKKKGAGDPITDGEACAIYAACIRERYTPRLKKLPKSDQARIAALRRLVIGFKNASFGIQYLEAGGGTIYSHLQRTTVIDDERFTESLIDPARRGKVSSPTEMANGIKKIDAWVAARLNPSQALKKQIEGYAAGSVEDLVREARTASTAWRSAQSAIKGRPAWEQSVVVAAFRQWTEPIVGEG